MKVPTFTLCLAGLTGLSIASPVTPCQETRGRFSIIAARSGSPVHLQSVNANGQAFWIGKATATFCPPQVSLCPPGVDTVLDYFEGSLSLDVSVPGGQRVYVTPTGELGFTQAHSVRIPLGSVEDGFTLSCTPLNGQFASLGFSKLGATGFLACPAGPDNTAPFKIFANVSALKDADVPGGRLSACIGIDALAVAYTGSGSAAWQYT